MSKKRKTRKQKESAKNRITPISKSTENVFSYKDIPQENNIATKEKKITQKKSSQDHKKDIKKIAAATGIVLAFDMLVFALFATNSVRLGFLGY